MKPSSIVIKNGNPILCIGDEKMPACAYMTYFDERNDYDAFAKKGFKVYSVSISLASQPINTGSGFMPYIGGVFDTKGTADFTVVDESIGKILKSCPDAYIFPRIYVCMPEWWIEENPSETIAVPHGKRRESLYSRKFRETAAEMLKTLIEHFKGFHASDRIFGYQISGGNTQEWFHLDLKGSYSEETLPYFNQYLLNKYPDFSPVTALPDIGQIKNSDILEDKLLTEYLRFASEEVAKTIDHLCRAAKDAVNNQQIIGVFYGYTAEVTDPLWGTHALETLLDSPNIDFISSPNSYMDARALGVDWADMMPVDSVKLHGKMCFIECDIRTFLTKSPEESRPGSDPLHYYSHKVWEGPATDTLSVYAVRKSLSRQLTHKHGLWWFDMFGHWYASEKLLKEMETSLALYNNSIHSLPCEYATEVAVILDEKSYSKIGSSHPAYTCAYEMRRHLAMSGAPYSVYLASDFNAIDWGNSSYKAVVFCIPHDDGEGAVKRKALSEKGIASICVSTDKPSYTAAELRVFFKENGVFVYSESDDIFYAGNGYVALHAVTEGVKEIRLPEKLKCTDTENGQSVMTDVLHVNCTQFETRLFKIEKV